MEFCQTYPHLLKQVARERGGGSKGRREKGGGVSDMGMFLHSSSFYEDVNEQRV